MFFASFSVELLQAINNLAVTDDNKLKIVEAGALPHYVKLLSPDRDHAEQQAAAHGLWYLASQCKDNIVDEPECLDGPYICLLSSRLFSERFAAARCVLIEID